MPEGIDCISPASHSAFGTPLELMDFISRLCDPVIVMAEGTLLAQGGIEEIKANEHVIEAYLGTGLKNKPPGEMEPVA